MLAENRITEGFLDPVALVVDQMRERSPGLAPDQLMLVGAWCRDVLHAALGHTFDAGATRDIDLAMALSGWETYEDLAAVFPRAGDSGVGFRIAGSTVDLIPFGEPEDPSGIIVPPTRRDAISVWAFSEMYRHSWSLPIGPSIAIRCPTVPGFTAAKLAAWLDRSLDGQTKDAEDLALTAFWYGESKQVEDRLYGSTEGQQILLDEDMDLWRAAARLLGEDVAATVGALRIGELAERWPGDADMLVRNFRLRGRRQWRSEEQRRDVVDALTRGLTGDPLSVRTSPEVHGRGGRAGAGH